MRIYNYTQTEIRSKVRLKLSFSLSQATYSLSTRNICTKINAQVTLVENECNKLRRDVSLLLEILNTGSDGKYSKLKFNHIY